MKFRLYIAPKMRMVEKALRWGAGAKNRKPWKDLFFNTRQVTDHRNQDSRITARVSEKARY